MQRLWLADSNSAPATIYFNISSPRRRTQETHDLSCDLVGPPILNRTHPYLTLVALVIDEAVCNHGAICRDH